MNTPTQNVMIFESFKVAMRRVNESSTGVYTDYIFEGICADFSERNRNGREYDKEEYLGFVNGSLAEQIAQKSLAGSLDHPEDAEDEEKDIFTPKMRELSHIILALWYEEATQQVKIRIKLLDTHLGKDAKACADAEMPIFISSRASGIIDKNGKVHLDNIHTFDIVYKPGFKQAKLARVLESMENNSSFVKIFENNYSPDTYHIIYDYKKGNYGYGNTTGDLPEWQEFTGKIFTDKNQALIYCTNANSSTPDDFIPNEEKIKKFKSKNIMETVSKQEFDSAIGKINESLILLSKSVKPKNKFKVNESKFTKRLKRLKVNEDESLDKQDIVALIVDATDAPIEDVAKSVTDETVEKINAILNDEEVFDKVIDIVEQDMGDVINEEETSETFEQSKAEVIKFLATINGISEEEAAKLVTDEMVKNYESSKAERVDEPTTQSINESLVKRYNKTFRKIYESEETLSYITNFMDEATLKEFNKVLTLVSNSNNEEKFDIDGVGTLDISKNMANDSVEIKLGNRLLNSIPCDDIKSVNESLKSQYIKESEEFVDAEEFVAIADVPASDKVGVIDTFNDLYGTDYDIVDGNDEETVEAFMQAQNQLTIESVAQKVDLANKSNLTKMNVISKRVNSIVEYMNTISESYNKMSNIIERQNQIIAGLTEQLGVAQTRLNNIVEYSNVIANSVNATEHVQTEQTNTINESIKIAKKRKQVFESLDDNINRIIANAVKGNIKPTGKNSVVLNEVPQKYSSVFESLETKVQNEILAYVAFKNPKSNLELESIWESLNLDKGGNSVAIFENTNFNYDDNFISKMIG